MVTEEASSGASSDPEELVRSRSFAALLVIAGVVGLIVSLLAWGFLELVNQIQTGLFTDLPKDVGYHHGAPLWWSLPICTVAGLICALAITRLPGNGGHVPAEGLKTGTPEPIDLPGILLAAFATIGLGLVLGPEAPLIALGGGLGVLVVRLVRRDAPDQLQVVVGAAGTFAAVSMIFGSPLIAAVILIEAAGLGGAKLKLVLLPGLLAAAIGSLVSIGMGSFTGLSTSAYSLGALSLPAFNRPTAGNFAWTILLAVAVAAACTLILRFARVVLEVVSRRQLLLLPVAGLAVSGLAVAFAETSGKGVNQVLFSGQSAVGPDVANVGAWSLSALALLIAFKGLAWGLSLASFRGGPTFPALFLGAAAGMMASHLPGFPLAAGVAVGMGAAVVAVLKLPLSAVVIATLLTSKSGLGATPLIVVAVVVAYVTTAVLEGLVVSRPSLARGHAAPAEPVLKA